MPYSPRTSAGARAEAEAFAQRCACAIASTPVASPCINICQIDGITTNFGGDHNTLIVHNQDTPGHVAEVTTALAQRGINIATMQLYRSTAGGYAVMVLECDQPLPDALIAELRGMQGIVKVTGLNLAQQTETKEGA